MLKVIELSRVISCWCKVVEFLCGKLRNSADEIFLPGIVKIAHSSSNSNVARGQVRCAGLSASTANHDLNSARAHHTTGTACMRNCKFLHEHTGARGSRGRNGAQRAPEVGTGGPVHDGGRDPVPVHFPPPEPVLLAPQTKVAAFQGWRPAAAAGEVSTGAGWWWAEHTARLRANIHSVSALLPSACVPCCCT